MTVHTFTGKPEFEKFCAQHPDKTHVVYKDNVYDVTEFLDDHPGGPAFILDFKNQDITNVLQSPEYHEHSENALRILYKYKIGIINPENETFTDKKTDEIVAYPKITKDTIEYNDFTIDRNKGMIYQVFKLNKAQYMHMIHNAIHLPTCRLFDNEFLEMNSHNPWYRIPMFWLPFCAYLMYQALTFNYDQHGQFDDYIMLTGAKFSIMAIIIGVLLGVFIWSFTEYTLHRFIFHFDDPLPDKGWALYLHFVIHGVHHTIPMDPDRLVFPPALGLVVYACVFPILTSLFWGNFARVVVTGFILGYIGYDMTHIYIHHCTPFLSHFKEMKSYHNKHHYVDGDKGFGISSKFWDKVFRTELL